MGLADLPGLRVLEFDAIKQCSYKHIVVELRDDWRLGRDATLSVLNREGMFARPYYHPPTPRSHHVLRYAWRAAPAH